MKEMIIDPTTYTHFPLKVAGLERELPICHAGGNLYIGAFVIFGDTELTTKCAEALVERLPEHDVMITAEAKGIPLICEMARIARERRYLLARKGPKLYMKEPISVSVKSITTEKEQTLYIDRADANYMNGKKVVIVDDVISTGESISALESLISASGGTIAGKLCILAEGDAIGREDITYLEELPLFFSEKK